MKELKQIIDELLSTNGKLDKQKIIRDNLNKREFVEVMKFLLNDFVTTGLSTKKIEKDTGIIDISSAHKIHSIEEAINYLLSNKNGSDYNIAVIQLFINESPEELQEMYKSIVTKSLKLGVSGDTWNKCVTKEDKIQTFDCMLAHKFSEHEHKIKGDFILTPKLDGNRVLYINGQFFTRTGNVVDGLEDLLEEMQQLDSNYVYDGELILRNDDNLPSDELFRATMKVARKDGLKKNLEFHLFDLIDLNKFQQGIDNTPCIARKTLLSSILLSHNFQWVKEVKMLYIGSDKEVIQEYLQKAIESKIEGLMLNMANSPYELKRSDKILKIKVFNDADLRIIGIEEGEGRLKGTLGNIVIEYKNNNVRVGTGFDDKTRAEIFNNQEKYIGKIARIKYFEESTNQTDDKLSLRFPVFIETTDKTEPSYN